MQPFRVFLDNNIFYQEHHSFFSGGLKELKDNINEKIVQLIITPVSIAELRKHYDKEIIQKILNKYRGLLKDLEKYSVPHSFTLAEFDIISRINKPIEEFLGEESNINLNCDNLNIYQILDDYQKSNYPFETKKENEFRDAINVQLLLRYQEKCKGTIYVVTNDKGVQSALKKYANIIVYKSLDDFLKYVRSYTDKKDIGILIEEYLESDGFIMEMNNELSKIDKYSFDCDDLTIKHIKKIGMISKSYSIDGSDNNRYHGMIKLHMNIEFTYINDKIKNIELFQGGNKKDVLIKGNTDINVSFPFNTVIDEGGTIKEFNTIWCETEIHLGYNKLSDTLLDLFGSFNVD